MDHEVHRMFVFSIDLQCEKTYKIQGELQVMKRNLQFIRTFF